MLRAKKTPSRPPIAAHVEPVSAKTSIAASSRQVKPKKNCATVCRPPSSTRLINAPIAAMFSTIPASQKIPNQITGSRLAAAPDRGSAEFREGRPALLARPADEAGLRHEEDREERTGDRERAAEDHPCPERDRADPNLREEPEHRARLAPASRPEEDRAHLFLPDLVCDPGLLGAARECVREAPERPEGDDQRRRGDEADHDPGRAGADVAEDQRESAAVGVGHDPRRHLEEEDRRLHRGAHQHQLQRREVQVAHEVDGHDDPRGQVQREVQGVVDGCRRKALHSGFRPSTQIHPLSTSSGSVMTTTSSMRSSKPAPRPSRRFVSAGKLEKNICTPSHSSVRSGLPTWLSDARKSPPGFSQRRMRSNSSAWASRGTWMTG